MQEKDIDQTDLHRLRSENPSTKEGGDFLHSRAIKRNM